MNTEQTQTVTQTRLDSWRAFAEQVRTDGFTIRQLVARGQGQAAAQLLGGLIESALLAGHSMDNAGANRPATLPPRPAPGSVPPEDWDELE